MKNIVILLFAALLTACASSAGRSEAVYNVENASISPSLDKTQVIKAVRTAMRKTKWNVDGGEADALYGKINVNDTWARVKIEIAEGSYSITYVDSKGLGYLEKSVDPKVPPRNRAYLKQRGLLEVEPQIGSTYNQWVEALETQIQRELAAL